MKKITVLVSALCLIFVLVSCSAKTKSFSLKTAAEQRGASFKDACTALGVASDDDVEPSEEVLSGPDGVTLADEKFNIGFISAPSATGTVGGLQITRTSAQTEAEDESALALEVYDLLVEAFGEPDRPDGTSDSLYFADAEATSLASGATGRDTWTLDDGTIVSYVAGIQNSEGEDAAVFSHMIAIGGN